MHYFLSNMRKKMQACKIPIQDEVVRELVEGLFLVSRGPLLLARL